MKKILIVFLLVICLFSAPSVVSVSAKEKTITDDFYESYVDFSLKTFYETATEANQVYAPVSLFPVLAMMQVMSSNEALTEFETLLGIDKATMLDQIATFTNDISVEDNDKSDFWFANSLYYDNQTNLNPEAPLFNVSTLEQYQTYFDYELKDIVFHDGSAGDFLANKITEGTDHFMTLKGSDFDMLKRNNILFHNAIYYKGQWRLKYDSKDSYTDDFNLQNGETVSTLYMNKTDTTAKYYSNDVLEAAKTYFLDGSYLLYVVPKDENDLNTIFENETYLSDVILNNDAYENYELNLSIPKINVTSNLDLVENLKTLGLNTIFSDATDTFPDLTTYPFSISDILQLSKFEVDEEGVKASSSTISIGCAAAAPRPSYEFKVNRPYIFILMSATDIPLFIGTIYQP